MFDGAGAPNKSISTMCSGLKPRSVSTARHILPNARKNAFCFQIRPAQWADVADHERIAARFLQVLYADHCLRHAGAVVRGNQGGTRRTPCTAGLDVTLRMARA